MSRQSLDDVSLRALDFIYQYHHLSKRQDLAEVCGVSDDILLAIFRNLAIEREVVNRNAPKLHVKQLKVMYENSTSNIVSNIDFRVRKKESRRKKKRSQIEIDYIIDNIGIKSYAEIEDNLGLTRNSISKHVKYYTGSKDSLEDILLAFTVLKCSKKYAIPVKAIYKAINSGDLKATKLGKNYVDLASLNDWVNVHYPDRIFYCFVCDKNHLKGRVLCDYDI